LAGVGMAADAGGGCLPESVGAGAWGGGECGGGESGVEADGDGVTGASCSVAGSPAIAIVGLSTGAAQRVPGV